jgi:ribosome-binding factor A
MRAMFLSPEKMNPCKERNGRAIHFGHKLAAALTLSFARMEESTRQKKVARLIQQDLAIYFQRNVSAFAPGGMITVTVVRVSPDLGLAKVYLSIFAVSDKQAVLKKVVEGSAEIRKYLGEKVRHQLRIVPELMFHIDDSLDHIERIDKLIKGEE